MHLTHCLIAALLAYAVGTGILPAQTPAVRDTVLTGYTRSALTPMYYGLGTDRLGGARMETLDSNVVLHLTGLDSARKFWRVRLAPTRTAFVPVEQVTLDSLRPYPTGSLTGNWTVSGDSGRAGADYVAIRLPVRLPYQSQQELNPSRLIVDVFGATANTNWITQLQSAQSIKHVWFRQMADEVFRVYIELKHAQSWGYSIYYQRTTLLISVRRPTAKRRLRGLTIAVDAGHGGANTGAKGELSGRFETEFTLDAAGRLLRRLEQAGARVLMVRTTDTNLSPSDRIRAMRRALPDLLISVHFNSSDSPTVRGVSTYYKHLGFRPLSQAILYELRKLPVAEFGNVGHFNFFFNAPTDYPNVLVEGPFLSNSADEALILTERFRQNMVKAIERGVKRFVKAKAE